MRNMGHMNIQSWEMNIEDIGLEKVSFHSNAKDRQCKECSNYCTVALNSHTSKVILKILQARLQQYVNQELPDVQGGFRKGRGTRSNCQHLLDHQKNKRVPEEHLLLLYWLRQTFDCVDHNKLENSSRDGNTRPSNLPPEKSVSKSGSNS